MPSKRKQRCNALQGIAGDLFDCRQSGIKMSKGIWGTFGKHSKNIAKTVLDPVSKSDEWLNDAEQKLMDSYEHEVVASKTLGQSAKSWTPEDTASNVDKLRAITHSLNERETSA